MESGVYELGDGSLWRKEGEQWSAVGGPRYCIACFLDERKDGHDPCLGELTGVMNACCGHGDDKSAYVQLIGGMCVRGKKALKLAKLLKGAGA